MIDLEAVKALLLGEIDKDSLFELERLREPLLKRRTELYRRLCEQRERLRHPVPEKGEPRLTDLDRTTMLNDATAELQEEYEYTKGLEELVKERVIMLREVL